MHLSSKPDAVIERLLLVSEFKLNFSNCTALLKDPFLDACVSDDLCELENAGEYLINGLKALLGQSDVNVEAGDGPDLVFMIGGKF